ncbi:MAG: hypothetical protein ACRDZR_10540 [Acidimicrobiales bacterium]
MDAVTKAVLLALVDDATASGWSFRGACQELELGEVRAYRWMERRSAGPRGLLALAGWILAWPAWIMTNLIIAPVLSGSQKKYEYEADAAAAAIGLAAPLASALRTMGAFETSRTGWERAMIAGLVALGVVGYGATPASVPKSVVTAGSHIKNAAATDVGVGTVTSTQLEGMGIALSSPSTEASFAGTDASQSTVISEAQAEHDAMDDLPGATGVTGATYGYLSAIGQPAIDQNAWVVALTPGPTTVGVVGDPESESGGAPPISVEIVVISPVTGAFITAHLEGPPVSPSATAS